MKYLQIKKEGSIATVSINRPDAMNALSIEVLKEFCTLQEYFRKDKDKPDGEKDKEKKEKKIKVLLV